MSTVEERIASTRARGGCGNTWDVLQCAGLDGAHRPAPRRDLGHEPLYAMTYNRMLAWVTAAERAQIEAADLPLEGGRKVRFSDEPLYRCTYLGCERPGTVGTLCKLHDTVRQRDADRRARWDARREAERAEEERAAQTRQRATELVAEAGPLLEELGIRPDTVKVTWEGLVTMPAEVADRLIRKAHEALEMEAM